MKGGVIFVAIAIAIGIAIDCDAYGDDASSVVCGKGHGENFSITTTTTKREDAKIAKAAPVFQAVTPTGTTLPAS